MRNKLFIGATAFVLCMVGAAVGTTLQDAAQPVSAAQAATFDHDQCQYPQRTTNPPDGCDNSDPCDPANTKGGSGDCNDDRIDTTPPTATTTAPATTPTSTPVTACGK